MTIHPKTLRMIAALREMTDLGISRTHCGQLLRQPMHTIHRLIRIAKIPKAPNSGFVLDAQRAESRKRAEVMVALYRDGYTLQEIGTQFGITRERARQLMSKHFGVSAVNGGKHVLAEQTRAKRTRTLDARCFRVHGCSFAQWKQLKLIGDEMRAAGRGKYQTPIYAFRNQRNNSANRGIAWDLTLWQWWTIWEQSGHWAERGRGQGYVMCRTGDVGPYSVGNVFIAKAAENSSEAQLHKRLDPSLPIGVRREPTGRFSAHRTIKGSHLYLGVFDTPELAHAAYLMAVYVPAKPTQPRGETKGYTGRNGRFRAYLYRDGVYIHLGIFPTEEAARAAHLAAKASTMAVAA